MKAKVSTEFPGRPDGDGDTRMIRKGEIITGDLAEVAIANKWATKVRPTPVKPVRASSKKKGG